MTSFSNTWSAGNEIYYQAIFRNTNQSGPVLVNYNDVRTGPVISESGDYEVRVVNLYLNTQQIPITDFTDDPNYWVSVANPDETNPGWHSDQIIMNETVDIAQDNLLFNITQLVDNVNIALAAVWYAHTPTGYDMDEPPMFYWDAAAQLMYLQQPSKFSSEDPYFLAFNSTFYTKFFSTFYASQNSWNAANHADFQFIFQPATSSIYNANLAYPWEESSALSLWSDVQNIFVTSNNLPLVPIIQPNSLTETQTTYNNAGSPQIFSFIPVGTGINILPSTVGAEFIYDNPQDSLYTTLKKGQTIQNIDFQVFYQTLDGTITQVSLQPNAIFSMKIQFRKVK